MKRRIGILVVLALTLSLALLTVASAHAELVSSDPAAGAKLTAAPSKVTLVFSEEISEQESDSHFTVTDESGATVGTGKLDTNDLDHKTETGALNAGLGDGVYTVHWWAVTPDDNGHTEGSFTFGVNKEPGVQPTAAPEPTEAEAATPTTATAGGAAQPTATSAPKPTAAPAGGAKPGTLPKTGESGSNVTGYLLAAAVIMLAGGWALRHARMRMR